MKTALEPYVIDFLRSKGYKYFLSETITCQNKVPAVLLKPCKNKYLNEDRLQGSFIAIENRDYVINKEGHKEWMWANIPNDELADLRRWQISYFAKMQPLPTE